MCQAPREKVLDQPRRRYSPPPSAASTMPRRLLVPTAKNIPFDGVRIGLTGKAETERGLADCSIESRVILRVIGMRRSYDLSRWGYALAVTASFSLIASVVAAPLLR